MKDMRVDWDSVVSTANRKVVLCYDRGEKQSWLWFIKGIIERDQTYQYPEMADRSEFLLLRDSLLGTSMVINFYCTNQWSWLNKMRGIIYDEVIVSRQALRRMEYPENLPSALSGCRLSGDISDSSLFLLTQNDERAMDTIAPVIGKTSRGAERSLSEDFDFPVSLFRRCMTNYFVNWKIPTREEFIFALTMEGISGSTDREKKAIEEAKFYLESQK